MFGFRFGPLTREWRTVLALFVALGAAAVLVGPAFATLASTRPAAALGPTPSGPRTIAAIRVNIRLDPGERCGLAAWPPRSGAVTRVADCMIRRLLDADAGRGPGYADNIFLSCLAGDVPSD